MLSSEDGGRATAPDILHVQRQVAADLEPSQLFSRLDASPPVRRLMHMHIC